MRFSKSLIEDKSIRDKLFLQGIKKSNEVLEDIFGIDFTEDDPRVTDKYSNEDMFYYGFRLELNGRKLNVEYKLNKNEEDLLAEVLEISEVETENIEIICDKPDENNFNYVVSRLQEQLEDKYGIYFQPLDPEDRDERIKEIVLDEKYGVWQVKFTEEFKEGEVFVCYLYTNEPKQTAKIIHRNRHEIYLD